MNDGERELEESERRLERAMIGTGSALIFLAAVMFIGLVIGIVM